jgi:hypothetical protein
MTLWSAEARLHFSAIRGASGLSIASSSRFVVAQLAAPECLTAFCVQGFAFICHSPLATSLPRSSGLTSHQSPVTTH